MKKQFLLFILLLLCQLPACNKPHQQQAEERIEAAMTAETFKLISYTSSCIQPDEITIDRHKEGEIEMHRSSQANSIILINQPDQFLKALGKLLKRAANLNNCTDTGPGNLNTYIFLYTEKDTLEFCGRDSLLEMEMIALAHWGSSSEE